MKSLLLAVCAFFAVSVLGGCFNNTVSSNQAASHGNPSQATQNGGQEINVKAPETGENTQVQGPGGTSAAATIRPLTHGFF